MKNLWEKVKNREPIKMYIKSPEDKEWTYLGVYEYCEERKKYEGEIGNITIEAIARWTMGDKNLDHLKIE